jgi:VanZ family protein
MLKLITLLKPYAAYILVAWVIIIIIVSSLPGIPTLKLHTSKSDIRLDYLIHFCEYGSLAFLAYLTFTKRFRTAVKMFFLVTIGLVLFAVADEFHQKLIPGRSFNVMDIISNISGILAAMVFCIVTFRKISAVSDE